MKLQLFFLSLFFSLSSLASSTVKIAITMIPDKLVMKDALHVDEFRLADLLADSLFSIGEGFQSEKELAETAQWNDEGRTLKITIRKAQFWDGSPVRAIDVKESVDSCRKNARRYSTVALNNIQSVEILSDNTKERSILIKLDQISPLLTEDLSHKSCAIIKKGSKSRDIMGSAVSVGPYKLVGKTSDNLRLQKNPHYFAKNTGPEHIVFKLDGINNRPDEMKSWADLITVYDGSIEQIEGYNRHRYSRLVSFFLMLNNSKAPFNSMALREALAQSIDFTKLFEKTGWLEARAQKKLFPYGVRGFQKRDIRESERVKANTTMQGLGYSPKKPLEFELYIRIGSEIGDEVTAWKDALEGSSFKARIHLVDGAHLTKLKKSGAFDSMRIGKSPGSMEPFRILTSFRSHSIYNTPLASYPDCDKLIDETLVTLDIDSRFQKYQEAEACLLSKHVSIPLASMNPGFVFIRKPWNLTRKNQYLLKPYAINEWEKPK